MLVSSYVSVMGDSQPFEEFFEGLWDSYTTHYSGTQLIHQLMHLYKSYTLKH